MYVLLTFHNISETQKEILLARLYEWCEGFEEDEETLKAILKKEACGSEIENIFASLNMIPVVEDIAEQNWNAIWESGFDPVVVDDFVAVRADFHEPVKNVDYEIVITPKMSFGTGHHATTFLMIQQMRNIVFRGKSVFDFGTGTGILAILAKKLGAAKVIATDIDNWSIENAAENFARNDVSEIELIQSDSPVHGTGHDIILANINKNILLETIPQLAVLLKAGGCLLLSGLLEADEFEIVGLCTKNSMKSADKSSRSGWIALRMTKL